MDLHSSRSSTKNICHAVAFKMVIRILFSLSSVKSHCKRYTRTATNDVNGTPMSFIYDVCPMMLMGETGRKWEEPSMGWKWQKRELNFEKQITTESVVKFYWNFWFLVFSSILNRLESVIHKRRPSEKFLMSFVTVIMPVYWGHFRNGLVSKVNGLCHKYLRLTSSFSLSISFGCSCHISLSLWSNV